MSEIIYVNENGEESVRDSSEFKQGEITYYDGKYYDIGNEHVYHCFSCNKIAHENLLYKGLCLKCMKVNHSDIKYCTQCKRIHLSSKTCNLIKDLDEIEEEICSYGESKGVQTEGHSFHAKGDCVSDSRVQKIGQFQSERELPKDIKDVLEKFYHGKKIFNHYYYRGDYKIEGDVNYLDSEKFRNILYRLKNIKEEVEGDIKMGYKVSPYKNYCFIGITSDGLIERAKYDLMGKEKHWTEKPNNFLQSLNLSIDNSDTNMNLHYILSSDLEHKLLAFQMNPKFGSCQKSENYDSYAVGAYDAITNGCNCPILIYRQGDKKPLGRITCRVMYDEKGKEYLLLERLYHDGTLGSNDIRGKMYAKIAHDLKCKGYNVIASNYSAHDSSTYSYLAKYGLSSNTTVTNLVQPLRQIPNGYGYYCDGGTNVLHYDIDGLDWATDYLDKAYLI